MSSNPIVAKKNKKERKEKDCVVFIFSKFFLDFGMAFWPHFNVYQSCIPFGRAGYLNHWIKFRGLWFMGHSSLHETDPDLLGAG